MSTPQNLLTTQAFAKKAGVSTGTVSKWLRSGKINGQKKNGRWLISEDEIAKSASPQKTRKQTPPKAKSEAASKPAAPQSKGSAYSVEAFSEMTYLTEYGVKLWLKNGKLISAMDDAGQLAVDAASLDQPHIKRLLR